jgi:hypothetical protein
MPNDEMTKDQAIQLVTEIVNEELEFRRAEVVELEDGYEGVKVPLRYRHCNWPHSIDVSRHRYAKYGKYLKIEGGHSMMYGVAPSRGYSITGTIEVPLRQVEAFLHAVATAAGLRITIWKDE